MRKLLQTCFAAAALVLAAGGAHAQSFCNTTPTSIPNSGNANPYPSALNVSGLAGSTNTFLQPMPGRTLLAQVDYQF